VWILQETARTGPAGAFLLQRSGTSGPPGIARTAVAARRNPAWKSIGAQAGRKVHAAKSANIHPPRASASRPRGLGPGPSWARTRASWVRAKARKRR
jgi:hypothetical protein